MIKVLSASRATTRSVFRDHSYDIVFALSCAVERGVMKLGDG